MKKTLTRGWLGILSLGLAVAANGQTAKDILDKMIEAQGGRRALESVKDSTVTGSLEMVQMGMNGSITIYQKEPNKMRMDIELMGMVITQATDGEKAWFTNPQTGAVEEMPGKQAEDMKRQALGIDAALHPEKYGITFAFKGKEKVGDKEFLVLVQSFKDGQASTVYIDPATYLTFKTKTRTTDMATGSEVEAETIAEDYKKVGDTLVAHKMTVFQNGAEFLRMTFVKVATNAGLEDSLFKMPK